MILDTNALSALAEKDPELIHVLSRTDYLAITLISYAEYRYGCSRSKRRKELEHWLEALMERCEIFAPSMETVPFYAEIRNELREAGTPIPANDVWIAALVREHQMPLVSRVQHFDQVMKIKRVSW